MRIYNLPNSSVLRIYSERHDIETHPEYQRMGEIWTVEKRQLFIDSLLNEFDVPKIYFHEFPELKKLPDGRKVKYAVIDGRQRLETIWSFIGGDFPLGPDFQYFEDSRVDARGLTYGDLATKYPELKIRLDSFTLPIVAVITPDLDKIEEMFSRLNEAVPLNAAEKRNALGGAMASAIREVAGHSFFPQRAKISEKRYQHREVAAKLLWLTHSIVETNRVVDTKKSYLDEFVVTYKRKPGAAQQLAGRVRRVLDIMEGVFIANDPLLKTQAMTVLYYLLFHTGAQEGWVAQLTRNSLLEFDEKRKRNRMLAEDDLAKASYPLLEFDRMSLQGSNDASSIRNRLRIITAYFKDEDLGSYLQLEVGRKPV